MKMEKRFCRKMVTILLIGMISVSSTVSPVSADSISDILDKLKIFDMLNVLKSLWKTFDIINKAKAIGDFLSGQSQANYYKYFYDLGYKPGYAEGYEAGCYDKQNNLDYDPFKHIPDVIIPNTLEASARRAGYVTGFIKGYSEGYYRESGISVSLSSKPQEIPCRQGSDTIFITATVKSDGAPLSDAEIRLASSATIGSVYPSEKTGITNSLGVFTSMWVYTPPHSGEGSIYNGFIMFTAEISKNGKQGIESLIIPVG